MTVKSRSSSLKLPIPVKPLGNVRVIISPVPRPDGNTNSSVWFAAALGAESESVSLKFVTLAASAKRMDGTPSDQRIMARLTVAAIAWSTENVWDVLYIVLYVVLRSQPQDSVVTEYCGVRADGLHSVYSVSVSIPIWSHPAEVLPAPLTAVVTLVVLQLDHRSEWC